MAEQDRENQTQPQDDEAPTSEASVNQALDEAQKSLKELDEAVQQAAPADLSEADDADSAAHRGIELLSDVDLNVMIELGRTEMLVEDVLKLGTGSVVELDKLAGDPVDVHVNGRLVARGEVLVLNDNFCIRISEIVANLEEEAEAAIGAEGPVKAVRSAAHHADAVSNQTSTTEQEQDDQSSDASSDL